MGRALAGLGGVALASALGLAHLLPQPARAQSQPESPARSADTRTLTVSAAASLTDALRALAPAFEARHPGSSLRFNFAASGVLLQQISQGAPVDVFASADQDTMNRAAAQQLIDPASRRDVVSNSLVLVEPLKAAVGIKAVADLNQAAVQRIAVGKVGTVPVGRYTKEALESAGLWATLEPRFVFADSVRQVLDYVSRGEVDAGFVYATDAAIAADKVKVVGTVGGHTPISYPIAVVKDAGQAALARQYLDFLAGPEAQATFARYGFGRP